MKAMGGTATATTTTTNDELKNNAAAAVFQSWLEKEAIPLDQVTNFAEAGGNDSWLWKAIAFVVKRPAFLFMIYYLVKQVKLYFETMRSSNKEGDKVALEL
jgi:hypothetical protein